MGGPVRLAILLAALTTAFLGQGKPTSTPLFEETHARAQEASDITSSVMDVQVPEDDDHHHRWGVWDGWGWWLFMPMMLVFWVAAIGLIMWLLSQWRTQGRGADEALQIARQRYARGEISREEFEQIKRNLGS